MKKSMSKRLLAMLLCVLMFVSLLPVSAFAEEDGEAEEPQLEDVLDTAVPEESEIPAAQEIPAVTGETGAEDPGQGELSEEEPAAANPEAGETRRNSVSAMAVENGGGEEGSETLVVAADLTADSFPYSVSLAAGETRYFRFTAPWSLYYDFRTESGFEVSLALLDENGNEVGGRAEYNSGVETYFHTYGYLNAGESYYLSAAAPDNAASTNLYLFADTGFYLYTNNAEPYAELGGSALLEVVTEGDPLYRVSYSWYGPDGTLLATTADGRYELTNVTRAGAYRCEAKDGLGNRSEASFEVRVSNNILLYAVDTNWYELTPGETRTLAVEVTGNGDMTGLSFQWYRAGDEREAIPGETGKSFTFTYDGSRCDYVCRMTDSYGNTYEERFFIQYKNHFSLSAAVDESDGWTLDPNENIATITLPAGNSGVTMKVLAEGDDVSGVEYSWDYSGTAELLSERNGDSLVLGPITKHESVHVSAWDRYGNAAFFRFEIELDNGLSVTPLVQDDWSVDDNGRVIIKLPVENEGVTLGMNVQANDFGCMSVVWECMDSEAGWYRVENAESFSLEIGPVLRSAEYSARVTDRFGNSRTLYYTILVGAAAPTDYIDLGYHNSPVLVDVGVDETRWVRFVAPESREFRFQTDSGHAISIELYDEEMNALPGGQSFWGSGEDADGTIWAEGAELWQYLEGGRTYYLALRSYQHGSGTAALAVRAEFSQFHLQPVNQGELYGELGEPLTLSAEVDSDLIYGVRYRWYAPDGTLLAETEEPWYEIPALERAGEYFCEARSAFGDRSTLSIWVRIPNDVWIYSQGSNEFSLRKGETVTFQVVIGGNGDRSDLQLQWYKGVSTEDGIVESKIPGATGTSYTLTFDGTPAEYSCVMTDRFGNVNSCWFRVSFENHFRIEPVLSGDWTISPDDNSASILLPVGNNGVTLGIRAQGDDLSRVTYSWNCRLGDGGAEVLSGSWETDTLTLGPVSQYLLYSVWVMDGHGNGDEFEFSIGLDNGFSVSPVLQDGWTVGADGTVQILLPPDNTGVTLAAALEARDSSDMQIFWDKVDDWNNWSRLEEESGLTLATGAVTERTTFVLNVTDRFGNPATVRFCIRLDNQLTVEPIVPTAWNVYHEDRDDFGYFSINGTIPPTNAGLTLQFKVSAADKSRLSVIDYQTGAALEPDDLAAEVWTYTITYGEPLTRGVSRQFGVRDGYGMTCDLNFDIAVFNAFTAISDTNNYANRVAVASGKTATLKLKVSGNDLSRLSISWYKVDAESRRSELLDQGKATSFTTPKITQNTQFYAVAEDGYGNENWIYFYVFINNKLKLTSTNGFVAPRGAIEARCVEVNEGASTTLKVTASASNTTGLKINWYSTSPNRNWETSEMEWQSAPIATASGKTSTFTVSDIRMQQTYYAQAVDKFGNTATLQFDVQVKNDLRAYAAGTTQESVEIIAEIGAPLTLSVDASANNMDGLIFQWSCTQGMLERNGSDSYTIPAVDWTQFYTCNVIDRFGNRTPVSFHVVADNNLRITPENNRYGMALGANETARLVAVVNEEDRELLLGEGNELAVLVKANDTEGITVSWMRFTEEGPLYDAGADGKVCTTEPVTPESGGLRYFLSVSDRYNNHANCVVRTEYDNHFVAEAVQNLVVVASGKKATLKVNVTADDAKGITYQWYAEGKLIKGATKASYTTPAIKKESYFTCVVKDRFGNQTGISFTVQVQNKLVLTPVTPLEQYVPLGGSAVMELQVTAKNAKNLCYQWYRITDGFLERIEGANAASLAIENVTDTQLYQCEVVDTYGNTDSLIFVVGVENGFTLEAAEGKLNYTFFKGLEGSLPVVVRMDDAAEYSGTWWILHYDNTFTSWLPLPGATTLEAADGGWVGRTSYTQIWNEGGVYQLRYEGIDKTGNRKTLVFTVTVLTIEDYVPAAPALAKTPDGVSVTFETVPAVIADSYVIQRRVGTGKYADVATLRLGDAALVVNGDGTATWLDTAVKNNTKYNYRIVAKNGAEQSGFGDASETLTAYLPPVLTGAAALADGVKVSWQKVAGASAYRVWRSVDDGEWEVIAEKVTAVTYSDKKAVSGGVNAYRVCALDKKGNEISALQKTGAAVYYLTAPALNAVLGTEGVELSWEPVDGAEKYRVERKVGKGAFEVYASDVYRPSYEDLPGDLVSGTAYSYRVTAVSAGGESLVSAAKNVSYYTPTELTGAEATANGVKLTWKKGAGASGYRIWRSVEGGPWEVVAAKVTKLTWTDATAGYKLTNAYRVQTLKGSAAVSEASNVLAVTNDLLLAMPTLSSVHVDFGGVTVSWDEVYGAEGYVILRKNGKVWQELAEVGAAELSYKDRTVLNKTAYTYTVKAKADGGAVESKFNTKGKGVTYYEAPQLLSITEADQGAVITWKAVPGAAKYSVLRWDDLSGQWIVAAKAVKGTSYTDKTAQPGWAYTVQALNSGGKAISAFDFSGMEFTLGGTGPSPANTVKIGLVTDEGGVNDGSFNQNAWEGLRALAAEDPGFEVKYLESQTGADYQTNINTFVDEEYDLIIGVGFMLADATREAAEHNPDQLFAIIDDASIDLPNVACLMFSPEQASYLVGLVAGSVTESKTVGYVQGMVFDSLNLYGIGYIAGVLEACPEATVLQYNANSFGDLAGGSAAARDMIAQGADVIYQAAGGTGIGVINACAEEGVWAIGVDIDQASLAPGHVLTSAVKRADVASRDIAKAVAAGEFTGGVHLYDLSNGGVDLAPTRDYIPADVLALVEAAKEAVIAGRKTVPSSADECPAFTLDD